MGPDTEGWRWLIAEAPRLLRAQDLAREIRGLLRGRRRTGRMLHHLYDHVLDEPVPDRLYETVRRHREQAMRRAARR